MTAGNGLELRGVVAGYGDVVVLRELSLTAASGRVRLVLGRNGAGKTTTASAAAGLLPLRSGSVLIDGADVTRMRPHRRVAAGLSLVQENKRIFRQRTVEENLLIGGFPLGRARQLVRERADEQYARFPVLGEFRSRPAGDLSGGQQQMLAIGQALMAGPRYLILDEPSAGLAPIVVDAVFAQIGELAQAGLGVVLIEQTLDRSLELADDVAIVSDGRVVLDRPAAEVGRAAVRALYLDSAAVPASTTEQPGDPALPGRAEE